MTYLELVDKLMQIGISPITQSATIPHYSPMGNNKQMVEVTPLNITCDTMRHQSDAVDAAITWAIDIDSWKHSWHNKVSEENYPKFAEIIEESLVKKAEEFTRLFSVYVYLKNQMATNVNFVSDYNDDQITPY